MKQLLILSGKGGTGKTTISGAFIELSRSPAFADCDVDAPNLHLLVSQMANPTKTDYYGFGKAKINDSKCIHCGYCEEICRFGAISDGMVDIYECEGCGVCAKTCPVHAITISDYSSGSLMLYKHDSKVFSTAQLKMGSGASGKLVTAVKKQLLNEAADVDFIIIDGSPGIGCPVIASISGADIVLIIAEPTISAIHDIKRIIDTVRYFGVTCLVCINKFDINTDNAKEIENYCINLKIPIIGKIPFDKTVIRAVNQCKSIACYPHSPAGKAIASMWANFYQNYLKNNI